MDNDQRAGDVQNEQAYRVTLYLRTGAEIALESIGLPSIRPQQVNPEGEVEPSALYYTPPAGAQTALVLLDVQEVIAITANPIDGEHEAGR